MPVLIRGALPSLRGRLGPNKTEMAAKSTKEDDGKSHAKAQRRQGKSKDTRCGTTFVIFC